MTDQDLEHPKWHACVTGDCDHDHANQCLSELIPVIDAYEPPAPVNAVWHPVTETPETEHDEPRLLLVQLDTGEGLIADIGWYHPEDDDPWRCGHTSVPFEPWPVAWWAYPPEFEQPPAPVLTEEEREAIQKAIESYWRRTELTHEQAMTLGGLLTRTARRSAADTTGAH